MNIWLIVFAVLPGLLIALYIYSQDKYEKEGRLPLLLCFLTGFALTWPIMWAERVLLEGLGDIPYSWSALIVFSFLVVGVLEEGSKLLFLWLYPLRRAFFNEPMDGIVYAIMYGMGFATMENLLYAAQFGWRTTLLRAFTAVPAHAVFSVLMGFYLGLFRYPEPGWPPRRSLVAALGWPLVFHGLYDVFVLQQMIPDLQLAAFIVLAVGFTISFDMIKKCQDASPFRP